MNSPHVADLTGTVTLARSWYTRHPWSCTLGPATHLLSESVRRSHAIQTRCVQTFWGEICNNAFELHQVWQGIRQRRRIVTAMRSL
jgi:hypothetical protein